MRGLARAAVEMATPFDLSGALDNDEFIEVCARLSEDNEEEKEERGKKGKERRGIRAHLEFYASANPDTRSYYLPRESERLSASYLGALLTDLPPKWIFDCATNRKGKIPVAKASDVRRSRA